MRRFHGVLTIGDYNLNYEQIDDSHIRYIAYDSFTEELETHTVSLEAFKLALSITFHPEGYALTSEEYSLAQSVLGIIRWMPYALNVKVD